MQLIQIINWSGIGSFEVTVTIIGIGVVFTSLILLVWFFLYLPKVVHFNYKKFFGLKPRILRLKGKQIEAEPDGIPTMTGETNAAIAAALFMYFSQIHDKESNVLTMNRIEKRYSPWSSKVYNMRNNPFK